MLSIRLMRTGKIHDPHYRIVVQEKRSKLNGKYVDLIGHYHPATKGKELVIDVEKADKWMKLGAQPSDTVVNLMVKAGVLDESRKIKRFYTATPKVEEAAPADEPKAEAVEEAAPEETEGVAPEEPTEAAEGVTEETPEPETAPAEEPAKA